MNLAITIVQTVIRSLLSILLLGGSARLFVNAYNATSQEKRAILQVADSVVVSNGNGKTKSYPIVILTLPNQTPRSFSVAGLYWNEQYTKGDYILVRYNPENPMGIRVDTLTSSVMIWSLPAAAGLLGLLLIPTVKQFKKSLKPQEN